MKRILPTLVTAAFLFTGCDMQSTTSPIQDEIENSSKQRSSILFDLRSYNGFRDVMSGTYYSNSGVDIDGVMRFYSSKGSKVTVKDPITVGMNDFTISFDIKAPLKDAPILSKYRGGVGAPQKGWNIQCENTNGSYTGPGVRFDISDGASGKTNLLNSGIETLDNEWHFVEIKFLRSSNKAYMYVDGVKKDEASIANIGNVDNAVDLILGHRGDSWNYFDGHLDNVKIVVGNSTKLLIDANDGRIGDESGSPKQVVPYNVSHYRDEGYFFNNNGRITQYDKSAVSLDSSSFTILFSIKAPLQDGTILSKYSGHVNNYKKGWNIQCEDNGGIGIRLDLSDGSSGQTDLLHSGVEALDNKWHDIKITYNKSTNVARMYVDNVIKDSANIASIGNIDNFNDPLRLGYRGDSWSNQYFKGTIENVRILDWAL